MVIVEILTSSGVKISDNINAPLTWFVNIFTLGFIIAWALFGIVFLELFCPEGQDCFPKEYTWWQSVLWSSCSLGLFAYLVLQFYLLVNWRQYSKMNLNSEV